MPTGYTSKLYNGNPQTFKDFALDCARAFGALIHMKDDGFDAPLRPDSVSNYHQEHIDKAQAKLKWLKSLNLKDCEALALKQHSDEVEFYEKTRKERLDLQHRYEKMLAQVAKWEPPTPDHKGLKEFMIEQLTTSIDHDCNMDYFPVPMPMSGEEWLKAHLQEAQRDIEYNTAEFQKEIERVNGRNEWVDQLRKSLD